MNSMSINILKKFESCFYPAEDKISLGENEKLTHSYLSTIKKITYFTSIVFRANLCLLALTISIPLSITTFLANRAFSVFKPPKRNENKDEILKENEQSIFNLPEDRGLSVSLFQSCGLGLEKYSQPSFEGKCNWNRWLTKDHIELKKDQKFDDFFVNYLDDPESLIKILKDMGSTAFRFSLERSIIEPKRGKYDLGAIGKYVNFCKKLKENNIKPWLTLEHFVEPDWFEESGGFENEKNIDDFVKYSNFIIPLFKDYVTNFMTFNEPTAFIFQTYIRKAFPNIKGKGNRFFRAAKVLRNILRTHMEVYKIKAKYPELEIGIVHQFLKFIPFNKNNPIERLVCYYTSLITHYAVYNFFKTKKFAFQIPFLSNVTFEVPKDQKLTDFIGFQCYGYPLVKIGFNGGKTHPGYKVTNLSLPRLKFGMTFGSVCEEKSKMMKFGMRFHPEALEDSLKEAAALKIPIAITETGCDANIWHWGKKDFAIDDKTQKEFYEKIFPILAKAKTQLPSKNFKGTFFWTFEREKQLEWERANNVTLGLVDVEIDPTDHTIKSHKLSPAAEYIKQIFQNASFPVLKAKIA